MSTAASPRCSVRHYTVCPCDIATARVAVMAWRHGVLVADSVGEESAGRILEAVGRVTKEEVDRCRTEATHIGKTSYTYAWVLDQNRHERERGISTCACAHTAMPSTPSNGHLTCRRHYTSVWA
jgi:hypothetical protein